MLVATVRRPGAIGHPKMTFPRFFVFQQRGSSYLFFLRLRIQPVVQELRRRFVAERRVQAFPVVGHPIYSNATAIISSRVSKRSPCTRSFLNLPNQLSVGRCPSNRLFGSSSSACRIEPAWSGTHGWHTGCRDPNGE